MSSERQMSLRDRYHGHVPDERLDFRLAAAMAVGLDALMARYRPNLSPCASTWDPTTPASS